MRRRDFIFGFFGASLLLLIPAFSAHAIPTGEEEVKKPQPALDFTPKDIVASQQKAYGYTLTTSQGWLLKVEGVDL